MDNRDHKIKVEYGVAAVVLLIGIFFIFQAFTITASKESVGPRTLPMILAVSLVLGGLWLAIRAYTGRAGDLKEGYGFLESDVKRIFMVVCCGALFVFLFWVPGAAVWQNRRCLGWWPPLLPVQLPLAWRHNR